MPVALILDHREQIQKLKSACQRQIDTAEELYIKSIFAREFNTVMPKLNGNRDEFERALLVLKLLVLILTNEHHLGLYPMETHYPGKTGDEHEGAQR